MSAGELHRTGATRVRTRLLAIVFLPVVALAAFSAYEANTRWRVVSGAGELSEDAERLSTLAPVAVLVAREMYLTGAAVVGSQHGFDAETVGTFLGVDLEDALIEARTEVDRELAELANDDPAQRIRAELEAVRADADRGTWTFEGAGYYEVVGDLHALALAGLRDAEDRVLGLAGAERAQRSLLAVEAAHDAASAIFDQLGVLGRMTVTDDGSLLPELGVATARLERAHETLDRLTSGAVLERWAATKSDPDVVAVDEAIAAVVERGGLGSDDPTALAQLFGGAVTRLDGYHGVLLSAADDAATRAVQLGDDARQRAFVALAAAALVIVATGAATAQIARSIGRPLRRLSIGADQIREGAFEDVELPDRGPREVRQVVDALREVVENLRVVEAQLGVLAAGALDQPILGEPVPGRIGESLHGSVARLSESMQEREALARRLEHEATHDALTGLPNRSAASREIARALARARRSGAPMAVLYIDLDDFKRVNDNHGHDAGDTVLRVTGTRLLHTVRASDFVARIGGDEFLVITERADDRDGLVELGGRIVEAVSSSIPVGAATTRIGASVGIATSGEHVDPDALLRDADIAGYEAKAHGGGHVTVFDDELRAALAHTTEIERSLRIALTEGELELWYQPVANAVDDTVRTVEALVRWNRPDVGIVLPAEFIPVAEASDLVIDVGRWALDTACAQLAAWSVDPALADLSVAVNLSGRHLLSMAVVNDVRVALEAWNVRPEQLVIEVTETVLVTDLPLVSEHLAALRATGVRVALDDFGTGYTSLAHLRSFPIDVLKIDRSLVESPTMADLHLLELLVGTAHTLGIGVIAEGVETEDQRMRMCSLGCDELQGYLIAPPSPVAALPAALARVAPVA